MTHRITVRLVAQEQDPAVVARAIIDANLYMVLGTADDAGVPWVSPVYYAPVDYREFLWLSSPDARHSRNVQARPEVGIVIFDSTVPIDTGQGVYMSAVVRMLDGDEVTDRIEVFSRRSVQHGGRPFTPSDVRSPSRLRLYLATALDHYVLETGSDRRIPVSP
jgi:uncharacterized protein YhbP (UPF0306 family)